MGDDYTFAITIIGIMSLAFMTLALRKGEWGIWILPLFLLIAWGLVLIGDIVHSKGYWEHGWYVLNRQRLFRTVMVIGFLARNIWIVQGQLSEPK